MGLPRCLTDQVLQGLLSGSLTDDAAEAACAHLGSCPACRDRAAAMATGDDSLRERLRALLPGDTTQPADPPSGGMTLLIPGYDIQRKIKGGGQGVVYLATQRATGQKVAIKVIREEADDDPGARRKFRREIELIAQMRHAHIVRIYDSGETADGRLYYVMEYVRGQSLRDHIQRERPALEAILELVVQITAAVSYAHERGIVHRDLKPSNVLIDRDQRPILLDFGLARWLAAPELTLDTLTYDVVGTLPYMSPEQARGHRDEIDGRTDVYALGVMLYEALTGHYPYPVIGRMADVLQHIIDTEPTPPSRSWSPESGVTRRVSGIISGCPIDNDLQTIILKALAKDPARRYQRVDDLRRDLQHYLDGESIEARAASRAHRGRVAVRRAIRRNPGLAILVAALFGVTVSGMVGTALAGWWAGPVGHLHAWVMGRFYRNEPLKHVRLLTLQDRGAALAAAEHAGITGVSAEDAPSWRLVYAALLDRAAAARPTAIGITTIFKHPSVHDAELAAAARRLRDQGIDTVIATDRWTFGSEPSAPTMSPELVVETRPRPATVATDVYPPMLQVFAARAAILPAPSFALAVVAAAREPGYHASLARDNLHYALMSYYRVRADLPTGLEWSAQHDRVPISRVTTWQKAELGLLPDDRVGEVVVDVPDPAVLHAATMDWTEFLEATTDQRREFAEGHILIVGNASASLPDGLAIRPVHLHAVVVDTLLQHMRRSPLQTDLIFYVLVACGAVVLGVHYPHPLWCIAMAHGLLVAGVALATVVGVGWMRLLFDPVPLLVAGVAVYWLTRWTRAVARGGR